MAFASRAVKGSTGNALPRLAFGGFWCSWQRQFSKASSRLQQPQPQPQKKEWLVIVPDRPGTLETRLSVRPQHLTDLKPAIEGGFWVMGGATLEEQPAAGDKKPPQINGSVLVGVADSPDEVLERLKSDVYSRAGVWDMSRVEIRAFRSVIRKEL